MESSITASLRAIASRPLISRFSHPLVHSSIPPLFHIWILVYRTSLCKGNYILWYAYVAALLYKETLYKQLPESRTEYYGIVRIIRITRLVKLCRITRVMRFFKALRTLIYSIACTCLDWLGLYMQFLQAVYIWYISV